MYFDITGDTTNRDQGYRLIQLGLPRESANCYIDEYGTLTCLRNSMSECSVFFFERNEQFFPSWTAGQLQRLIMKARGEAIELHPDISPLEACMRYAEITDFSKLEEGE